MLGLIPPNHQDAVRHLLDQAVITNDIVLLRLILTRTSGSRLLIESQDCSGTTAIHKSSFWGYHRILSAMIDNGIDINVRDHMNRTPLHIAAMEGHKSVVRLLLESGADPYVEDKSGTIAFELCEDEQTRRIFPKRLSKRKCKSEYYEFVAEKGLSLADKKLCRSDSGIVADQPLMLCEPKHLITYESFVKSRESVV